VDSVHHELRELLEAEPLLPGPEGPERNETGSQNAQDSTGAPSPSLFTGRFRILCVGRVCHYLPAHTTKSHVRR
jgi:hypothetical protein